ncbi:two pore domain potassium channel family protein [Streptomyces sp. GC420]|nr:two pore domain potassium channel family protein [Streptomyces sp. GC420]
MVVTFFLLPDESFGPHRPTLSWSAFIVALCLIAALLLRQIRNVLTDREDSHPGLVIPLLICLSVLVFASAYLAMSKAPGEFPGLNTRLDALYFTMVTLATVGYGDIVPHGQTGRLVVIVQISYSFVFLTAAATALSRAVQRKVRQPDHAVRTEEGTGR